MSKDKTLCLFPDYKISNKGKTWEEIYGKEQAEERRLHAKTTKRTSTTKGRKWEDIYTPEEVKRRRDRMKNNNPYNSLTQEQKDERNKLCSIKAKERMLLYGNPMQGKTHTPEVRAHLKAKKKAYFSKCVNVVKYRVLSYIRSLQYFEDNSIKFICQNCGKEKQVLISHTKRNKPTYCNSKCQHEHFHKKPSHFNFKPNGWEQFIIDLAIPNIKYVGDHSFWITFKENGRVYHKNPDFIITPFSDKKKVIEVWGKRWHTKEEMLYVQSKYNESGIAGLLLTNENFTDKNKKHIKTIIEEWLNNVK